MKQNINLDGIRKSALQSVEKSERNYKLTLFGVAGLEALFLIGFVLLTDFSNRTHLLLFVATIATYTLLGLGIVTLGAYINHKTHILLKAITLIDEEKD